MVALLALVTTPLRAVVDVVLPPRCPGCGEIARPQSAQSQDDRFVAAIDVTENPVTLAYVVRAVTPGSFALPGVVAEDMYRPEVFARSAPGRVTVPAAQGAAGGR